MTMVRLHSVNQKMKINIYWNCCLVPIFDATETNFDFSRKNLDDLEKVLPKYSGGEINSGSLVMVAYTMSAYLKKGVRTLSPNLNWVVVIREA